MQSDHTNLSILLVEDDEDHADILEGHLRGVRGLRKPHFVRVPSLIQAKDALESNEFSVILLDLGLPDSNDRNNDSEGPVATIDQWAPRTPIIVITALNDEATSDKAIQKGAQDYLTKETISGELVYRSIRYAIERKKQLIELERQNEDLAAFARAASHDLRSPLGNLRSIGQMLTEEIPEPRADMIDELLTMHEQVAMRLETLISDILRFSRLGAKAIKPELFPLNDAVDDVRQLLKTELQEREAELHADNLLDVFADRGLTVTVLQNLIGNGIKYVRDKKPVVTISTVKDGRFVRIAVADNGIGIPEDCLSKIFQPLQRAVAGSEFEGSGLGLATVKRVVGEHGGRVWVKSTEGDGATFFFTLPAGGESAHTTD